MQKRQLLLGGRRMFLLNFIFAVLLSGGFYWYWLNAAVPAAAMPQPGSAVMGMFSWREVLGWGIPGLAAHQRSGTGKQDSKFSLYPLVHEALDFFTNVNSRDLRSVLRAELPWLAAVPVDAKQSGGNLAEVLPKLVPAAVLGGKPLVGIYHTHTAESFVPSTGVAHRPGGQIGEICDVGAALTQALQQQGIAVLHDKTIHDSPSFMKAYGASEVTVTKLVKENPSLQMIFDVHRDADKRENVSGEIKGETVAKISIIVAQGQKDLPQPQWQENYALAKLIDSRCNARYPGLSRGIQLVEWRYNQHLHPHALLLEVGSHETSTEEAMRSMRLLAEVLAEIIKEGG